MFQTHLWSFLNPHHPRNSETIIWGVSTPGEHKSIMAQENTTKPCSTYHRPRSCESIRTLTQDLWRGHHQNNFFVFLSNKTFPNSFQIHTTYQNDQTIPLKAWENSYQIHKDSNMANSDDLFWAPHRRGGPRGRRSCGGGGRGVALDRGVMLQPATAAVSWVQRQEEICAKPVKNQGKSSEKPKTIVNSLNSWKLSIFYRKMVKIGPPTVQK